MVSADRVKRKLPSLLVDDCSNRNKESWNKFMRSRYRIQQFKKKNPEKFNNLTNKIIADLSELEKEVSNDS
jgi:hypothetical protein